MTAAAASAIFDRPRHDTSIQRDRDLLTAAARLETFTIEDVVLSASRWDGSGGPHYQAARRLLRLLWMEGHLKLVDGNTKPLVYAWVEQ